MTAFDAKQTIQTQILSIKGWHFNCSPLYASILFKLAHVDIAVSIQLVGKLIEIPKHSNLSPSSAWADNLFSFAN